MCRPCYVMFKLCWFESGNIPKTSAEYNRADAKAIRSIFNANCSPAAAGRTSDARPYNDGVFLNNAPVGAAIGRPPVKFAAM